MSLGVTVIVTTYNWPQALERVLCSLSVQTNQQFEIIVADDGSGLETKQLIGRIQATTQIDIKHLWQEDLGFRAAKIRNKAAAMAKYAYIVFIDGDCIVPRHFIAAHAALAEKGWFVAGNRVLINQKLSQTILSDNFAVESWSLWSWLKARLQGDINRWLPLLTLPLGRFRKLAGNEWYGVKTCNLALWREDFIAVNGFDENYEGWGFEDSDLVCRLQRLGVRRKSGRHALTVFHLWHPENARDQSEINRNRLEETLTCTRIKAVKGVNQYEAVE